MHAPILLFAYLRPDHLRQTLNSLQACTGFENHTVCICVDGLKTGHSQEDAANHLEVVRIATEFDKGRAEVRVAESNQGLARAVHKGVSDMLRIADRAIVLEDDLILAADFLVFMDECLTAYQNRSDVFSISGFCHYPPDTVKGEDVFLFPRPGSWGWATWAGRWNGFRLENIKPGVLRDIETMDRFNKGGRDLSWMLRNSLQGRVNSWAVQWAWYQFINQGYSVYPTCSKVENTGFGEGATHTSGNRPQNFGEQAGSHICTRTLHPDPAVSWVEDRSADYRKFYKLGMISSGREWLLRALGK